MARPFVSGGAPVPVLKAYCRACAVPVPRMPTVAARPPSNVAVFVIVSLYWKMMSCESSLNTTWHCIGLPVVPNELLL